MITWVLFAGLPATGKSALAASLGNRLNAVTLDKDRIRSTLFPGALTDYSTEQDDLCMRALLDAAAYLTTHNRAEFIFIDGRCFSQRRQIEEVLQAADRAGAAWKILHLTCEDAIAQERLNRDNQDLDNQARQPHPARNRSIELYLAIKRSFEPISYPKLDVDTTHGIEAELDEVYKYLAHEK